MMHLELSVAPVWSRVSDVRETLLHAARAVGLGEERSYAIGLVVSELLENAIKYGRFSGAPSEAIQVVVHIASGVARVVVTNPVDAGTHHPQRLRSAVTRLSDASPLDAYVHRVSEILDEAPSSQVNPTAHAHDESGLGIFRVAHEAESAVSVRFLAEGSVEVTAAMRWVGADSDRELVA
jgi:anti-sigma regulatory factor (Ser/Thr protein kinase)